jgi:hypothetical protein
MASGPPPSTPSQRICTGASRLSVTTVPTPNAAIAATPQRMPSAWRPTEYRLIIAARNVVVALV